MDWEFEIQWTGFLSSVHRNKPACYRSSHSWVTKNQHGKNLEKLQGKAIFTGAFQDWPGETVTSNKHKYMGYPLTFDVIDWRNPQGLRGAYRLTSGDNSGFYPVAIIAIIMVSMLPITCFFWFVFTLSCVSAAPWHSVSFLHTPCSKKFSWYGKKPKILRWLLGKKPISSQGFR